MHRPAVLVVDDEPNICAAVGTALADRYQVHAALCGADAWWTGQLDRRGVAACLALNTGAETITVHVETGPR